VTFVTVGYRQISCKAKDLSESGILLRPSVELDLASGTEMDVRIFHEEWLEMSAKLVRIASNLGPAEWGLSFWRMSGSVRASLTELISQAPAPGNGIWLHRSLAPNPLPELDRSSKIDELGTKPNTVISPGALLSLDALASAVRSESDDQLLAAQGNDKFERLDDTPADGLRRARSVVFG